MSVEEDAARQSEAFMIVIVAEVGKTWKNTEKHSE
jgi:hypothetical protein